MFNQGKKISNLSSSDGKFHEFNLLHLRNVVDYTACDSFWKRNHEMGSRVFGDTLLCKALDMRRAFVSKGERPVFTSVIIMVPPRVYSIMRKHGLLDEVADRMAQLHAQAYSEELNVGRYPRYLFLPCEAVVDEEVWFVFGESVFVPGPDDKLLYSLEISIGEKVIPAEYPSGVDGEGIPVGIYEGQTGLRIGIGNSPMLVDRTLWGDRGFRYVNISTSSVGEGEISILFEGQERRKEKFPQGDYKMILQSEARGFFVREGKPAELALSFKKVCSEDSANTIDKVNKAACSGADGSTCVVCGGDEKIGTFHASRTDHRRGRLVFEGILLPRLDKIGYTVNGVEMKSWTLWFDENGRPYREKNPEAPFTLHADNESDTLFFMENGGVMSAMGDSYDAMGMRKTREVPDGGLSEYFLGIMELPVELTSMTLSTGESRTLGRNWKLVDYSLDQLDVKDCVVLEDGSRVSNLDRMTSRKHLEMRLTPDSTLEIKQLSKSVPVYILDSENRKKQVLGRLGSGDPSSASLESGDKLIVGSYLLRFEPEGVFVNDDDKHIDEHGHDDEDDVIIGEFPTDLREWDETPHTLDEFNGFVYPAGPVEAVVLESLIVEVLDTYIHEDLAVRDKVKPEISKQTWYISNLLDLFFKEKKGIMDNRIHEVKGAFSRLRMARNLAAHRMTSGNEFDRKLECVCMFHGGLTALNHEIFDAGFRMKNACLIGDLMVTANKTRNELMKIVLSGEL